MDLERKGESKWEVRGTPLELQALQALIKAAKTDGISVSQADISETEVVATIETGSHREFSGDSYDDNFLDRF